MICISFLPVKIEEISDPSFGENSSSGCPVATIFNSVAWFHCFVTEIVILIMPRRSQEAYCSRVVCLSVCYTIFATHAEL